jgi:hypothetical protein
MDVHPTTNGITRYWSIPTSVQPEKHRGEFQGSAAARNFALEPGSSQPVLGPEIVGVHQGAAYLFWIIGILWEYYEIWAYGYGSIPIDIFLGGWTSINPSYFDVNYRGTRVLTHPHIIHGDIHWDYLGFLLSSSFWKMISYTSNDIMNLQKGHDFASYCCPWKIKHYY